jgi:hypothetical protein
VVGCCEHGNENLRSVKCGEFMHFLKEYCLKRGIPFRTVDNGGNKRIILRWRSRSRHCTASEKVASSSPDGFVEIFHSQNPSGPEVD